MASYIVALYNDNDHRHSTHLRGRVLDRVKSRAETWAKSLTTPKAEMFIKIDGAAFPLLGAKFEDGNWSWVQF